MKNFDSLTLKYFFLENKDFINGAIVQKIQLPSRHEIILTLRNLNKDKPQNKKLYININPKYPHICFLTDETIKKRNITIPPKPPMFCMQLRKYLNGSKIKDFKLVEYERILELYFDYFDEIGSISKMCLALEFMGKHSNIILYNSANKIITGSIHNISQDKSSIREIYGGINYIYPPLKNKLDILKISYSTFFEISKEKDFKKISDNFYYFSTLFLEEIFKKESGFENIFSYMQNLQNGANPAFIKAFWENKESVSDSIDEYFSNIMFDEILKNQKSKLKSILKNEYNKVLKLTKTLPTFEKAQKYKLFGDLIMTNLYSIKINDEIEIENNKIKLDKNLSLQENAQKYYQKYKKEKTAFTHFKQRFDEAIEKLNYFETILFNIENSSNFDELNEIYFELSKIGIIKEKIKEGIKEGKTTVQKLEFKGFEIYIGKNNKQNDYLISKIAKDDDLWFHGQNFPSAHIILKVPNNKQHPSKEVLEFCAKLTKENSKARDGGKAPIIMTKRKNLKKPSNTYPGYVTYKNEVEIII